MGDELVEFFAAFLTAEASKLDEETRSPEQWQKDTMKKFDDIVEKSQGL